MALSTQFLFQPSLYDDWSGREIALAWLQELAHVAVVAFAIVVAAHVVGRVPARNLAVRSALYAAAVAAGAFGGEWAVLWVRWHAAPSSAEGVMVLALRWLPLAAICGAIAFSRARAREHELRLHQLEVDRLQLEREATASEVGVLQSRVEPHFLFNTLATIRRLQKVDPVKGRAALSGFLCYLQFALPAMRSRLVPLEMEVALVAAYLDVLQVRMGNRLTADVDVPAGLRHLQIPPLSLATLVENAIKHGLAGLPEGGSVTVRARRDACDLVLTVADTGQGFVESEGTGSGLANLRMRLRGLYDGAATLALSPNEPRGFRATVRLPCGEEPRLAAHA
ncbi:MAG TPA: histidine kinase [Gemmatimonadaceae bacterium]|nr:histidine kinase [Gemmatimonadaceae bacterium]